MKVHLVIDNVDLGYHVIDGFVNESNAIELCNKLNQANVLFLTRNGHSVYKDRYEIISINVKDI
jgi:hypothetical protein